MEKDAILLEELMVLVDEALKNRFQDADRERQLELEKLAGREQELRLMSTEGHSEAREFTRSRIYFVLDRLHQKVNTSTIDRILEQYHINYFTNLFTGDNSQNIEKPIDREIEQYFRRYCLDREDPYDKKLSRLSQVIYQELYGFSILDELVFDSDLDEVACNRFDYIWIQFNGIKRRIPNKAFRFASSEYYGKIIENRLVSNAREEMNAGEPVVMAVLKNGSRVTALRPPLARHFTVNIRLFNYGRHQEETRKRFMESRLELLISILAGKGRRNIAVIGEQGSGKTTAAEELVIKALDSDISIGLAENVHELNISGSYPDKNVVELQYGKSFKPSDVTELFFRLNRDIIIYGEVRSCLEAFEMIKAMLRQARGSLFTFHSSGVTRMIHDLRQLLMQTGYYTDFREAQFDVADAVDLVVQLKLDRSTGNRYVYRITEVIAREEDMGFETMDLFVYDRQNGCYRSNGKGPSLQMLEACMDYEMTLSDRERLLALFEEDIKDAPTTASEEADGVFNA